MAREYITLGATPAEEDCAQVGRDDYRKRSRWEMKAYIEQLKRMFPDMPESCTLQSKGFQHDYGTYHEVCIFYDPEIEESVDYALTLEGSLPAEWDEEARVFLHEAGVL